MSHCTLRYTEQKHHQLSTAIKKIENTLQKDYQKKKKKKMPPVGCAV